VVMWPNSTIEQLFETADSPMMTRKIVLQRLNAEGYGQHATSFVDVQTEAQFAATLADIKRRRQASATVRKREAGASPATIRWHSTGALHEIDSQPPDGGCRRVQPTRLAGDLSQALPQLRCHSEAQCWRDDRKKDRACALSLRLSHSPSYGQDQ
jgi:hypothetical protein